MSSTITQAAEASRQKMTAERFPVALRGKKPPVIMEIVRRLAWMRALGIMVTLIGNMWECLGWTSRDVEMVIVHTCRTATGKEGIDNYCIVVV
jgi:hypothetical protein